MQLNNLKVGTRLGAGFGVVLLLMLCVVALSIFRFSQARADFDASAASHAGAMLAERWALQTELNISHTVAIAKSVGMPQMTEHFGPLMKQTDARIAEMGAALKETIGDDTGRALLAAVDERQQEYAATRARLEELMRLYDQPAVDALVPAKLMPQAQAYLAAITQLREHVEAQAAQRLAADRASLSQAQLVLAVLLALSLAIGVAMAVLITRSVTQPVRSAVQVAEVIARNDLSQRVDSTRRDELGDLLRALGGMQQSLRQMVGQVRATTESINGASGEIASGNHDLSSRTEQTAANLQQAAASMDQLTGTVKNSADSARQANQLASNAASVAARGGEVVSQVVATMDEINASSKKIADIIGVIDGIAFQTNILALNAAVEAARAGEQGRGFAVVATEVRGLAQRSAEAAKEIKALISASVDKVEGGSRLVADAGQTMQEIVGSVQRVTDIIGEITAAADEQSDGIGQVNTAVLQLDQMTQQNAALVEESAAAAMSLKDQAGQLSRLVSAFTLDEAGRR